MQRFFDRTDTHWRRLDRCLHLYALPDPSDDLVGATLNVAGTLRDLDGIGIQPPEFLHVTLQRLDAYEEDLSDDRWQRLLSTAPKVFAARPALKLDFAKPRAMSHAVEAVADGGVKWAALIASIRQLILGSGLPVSTLTPAPVVPHYTVAYCTQERGDGPITAALKRSGTTTSMRIREVSLVSVTQAPDAGIFSFDVLERWPLGDRLRWPQTRREQERVR